MVAYRTANVSDCVVISALPSAVCANDTSVCGQLAVPGRGCHYCGLGGLPAPTTVVHSFSVSGCGAKPEMRIQSASRIRGIAGRIGACNYVIGWDEHIGSI